MVRGPSMGKLMFNKLVELKLVNAKLVEVVKPLAEDTKSPM
mgnify:CR=1 FL=1